VNFTPWSFEALNVMDECLEISYNMDQPKSAIVHGTDTYTMLIHGARIVTMMLVYAKPFENLKQLPDIELSKIIDHIFVVKAINRYPKPIFSNGVNMQFYVKKITCRLHNSKRVFFKYFVDISNGSHTTETDFCFDLDLAQGYECTT